MFRSRFADVERASQTFSPSVGEDIQDASNICVAVFHNFVLTFHKKPRLQLVANVLAEMQLPTTDLRSDWVLMLVVWRVPMVATGVGAGLTPSVCSLTMLRTSWSQ